MHPKRLTLIGVAAIAAGYTFLSSAGPADDLPRLRTALAADAAAAQCTPAATPDLPAAAHAARAGYRRVCHADLARFDVSAGLKPLPLALAGLDFTPADLADTPLATFTSLGGMAEVVDALRSRLYRSFRMPDGRMLTLFEHDLSSADMDGAHPPHDARERINGMPARLDVLQGDAGRAVSVLSWRDGRRDYRLWVDANVTLDNSRARLLALAATLPRAAQPMPPVPSMPASAPQAQQGMASAATPVHALAPAAIVLAAGHAQAADAMPAPR
jgi:hypothetical protein